MLLWTAPALNSGQSTPIPLWRACKAYSRGLPFTREGGDERVEAAGGRGTSFAAPLRGLLHFGPSHDILRHRFAITCLSRAPRRYIGPRVDKPAPTLSPPPFFSSPSTFVVSPVYAFECRPETPHPKFLPIAVIPASPGISSDEASTGGAGEVVAYSG